MKNAELKDALMSGRPVRWNGSTYAKVSAVIYRNRDGTLYVTAELLDVTKNSVVITTADKISYAEENNDQ